ncbi:MAG TPA: ComEC/Rec2 family competence protein [Candidatus Acidoferrales bacterium]|nr:ComEC/Rec2 family competence protein [Candidatus Acidoferrales bacterium]
MKLPALWIAAAFGVGILIADRYAASPKLWLGVSVAAIGLGGVLLWRARLTEAWSVALVAWVALGGFGASLEHIAVPANHVTRLLAAGQIDTAEPLRWQGRLREDPLRLPWGQRYEIDLENVEIAGAIVPVTGGLRANFYSGPRAAPPPEGLRAGNRIEALLRARPPRNFLDPGAADVRGYLARQKIDVIGSLRSGELLRLIDRPRPTLQQRLARIRGDLLARLDSLFASSPERSATLRAMLLGDRSFVDSSVVTAFQKTAAYHVLVVAGLHTGALVVFVFWFCRRLRLPIAAASFVTIAALAAYVGVVQDRPPIFRAALMAAFYLLARPLFRRIDLLNTVSLAALTLLIWRPSSLVDSSFQLSFLAAGVIAGLALPWMDRTTSPFRAGLAHLGDVTRDVSHPPRVAQFRIETRAAAQWLAARLPRKAAGHAGTMVTVPLRIGLRLCDVMLLSTFMQWGMMPVLAQAFHRVTLLGPLSNIPAVLLTGLIVPLGFLTLAATFVWARLAAVLAAALNACAGMLLASVEWFSHWPRVSYRIPGPPMWLLISFFAALICLAAVSRAEARRRSGRAARRQLAPLVRVPEWVAAAALAALTLLVATYPFAPNLAPGKLELTVLDVGQGDSLFAAFPDGRTMLIDGGGLAGSESVGGYRSGPDVGEEVVSPYLWSRGLKKLDVVALTHADHDHIDGLYDVLDNFRVKQLWIGRDDDRRASQSLLAEARAHGVAIAHETRGMDFDWGGAEGQVLWPQDAAAREKASNDDSMVMRLGDGTVHFLLTGDIERNAESGIVDENVPLASDFLKVPHHGSKTSSTDAFLAAVAPRVAVASVGESNPFGHPAEPVVERYERAGVRFLRTDRDGAVTALTNGRELTVSTFAESHPN